MLVENPCIQIGCWECCRNMVFLATGGEVYEMIKALEEKLQTKINYRFVDFNSITGQLVPELEDGEYEFIIAIKFKRDRRCNMVVPKLEQLQSSEKRVRVILNGDCPALEEVIDSSFSGKQCSLYGNEARFPACNNFLFDPNNPVSACSRLRQERNED